MKKSDFLFKVRAGLLTASAAAMIAGNAVPVYAADSTDGGSAVTVQTADAGNGIADTDTADSTAAADVNDNTAAAGNADTAGKNADTTDTDTSDSADTAGTDTSDSADTAGTDTAGNADAASVNNEGQDADRTADADTAVSTGNQTADAGDQAAGSTAVQTVTVLAAPAAVQTNDAAANNAADDKGPVLDKLDPSIWSDTVPVPVVITDAQLNTSGSTDSITEAAYFKFCFHDPRDLPRLIYQNPTEYELVDKDGNLLTDINGYPIKGSSSGTMSYWLGYDGLMTLRVTQPNKTTYNQPEIRLYLDLSGVNDTIDAGNEAGNNAGSRLFVYCDESYPFVNYVWGTGKVLRAQQAGWYYTDTAPRIHVMYLHAGETVNLDTGESQIQPDEPEPAAAPVTEPAAAPVTEPTTVVKAQPVRMETKQTASISSPKTGDETPIGMMAALCGGSALALLGMLAAGKKEKEKV